ncbi:MAG: hypothetical protein DDT20_01812 [Firmicutes bacterium]|nr:hypothetical protein [Bacillota bacterium]
MRHTFERRTLLNGENKVRQYRQHAKDHDEVVEGLIEQEVARFVVRDKVNHRSSGLQNTLRIQGGEEGEADAITYQVGNRPAAEPSKALYKASVQHYTEDQRHDEVPRAFFGREWNPAKAEDIADGHP